MPWAVAQVPYRLPMLVQTARTRSAAGAWSADPPAGAADLPEAWGDGPLSDGFGRELKNLRVSVTDRCNFRCTYCMPEEGLVWLKREDLLSYEEIERLGRLFVHLGIAEVRLPRGGPLGRRGP